MGSSNKWWSALLNNGSGGWENKTMSVEWDHSSYFKSHFFFVLFFSLIVVRSDRAVGENWKIPATINKLGKKEKNICFGGHFFPKNGRDLFLRPIRSVDLGGTKQFGERSVWQLGEVVYLLTRKRDSCVTTTSSWGTRCMYIWNMHKYDNRKQYVRAYVRNT